MYPPMRHAIVAALLSLIALLDRRVTASSRRILDKVEYSLDYYSRDNEICECASLVAQRYFYRPHHVALVMAYAESKSKRCDVGDTTIFQELPNYLVNYVSDFSCLSLICDAIVHRVPSENFIVVTESAESLLAHVDLMPEEHFNYGGRIVIVVKTKRSSFDYKATVVQGILDACWALRMINALVLMRIDDDVVGMFTYFPYNEKSCGKSEMVLLNNCSDGYFASNAIDLYPMKTLEMHGCPVRVTTVPRYPHVIVDKLPNGTLELRGVEGNMVKTLGALLNYTLVVVQPKDEQVWGRWNGVKWTGASGDLVYNRAEIGVGAYYPSLMRFGVIDFSFGYDTVDLVWTIPRLERSAKALKLLLPFKKYVWLLTLLTVFLVTTLLYCLRKKIRNRTLRVRGLAMSVWQVTLGLGLERMPPGRFVCYVLAVWIWMSMVLRNIYQGSLVGFLTHKFYDDSLRNMRDLLDADFAFFGTLASVDIMKNVTDNREVREILRRITVVRTDEEYDNVSLSVARGQITGALLHFATRVPELNYKFEGEGGTLVVLPETYRSQIITMAFVKFAPLLEAVNAYVHRISEAGLVDKWLDDHTWPAVAAKQAPVVLAMHHVAAAFALLVAGLLAAAVAFAWELRASTKEVDLFGKEPAFLGSEKEGFWERMCGSRGKERRPRREERLLRMMEAIREGKFRVQQS